MKRLLAEPLLHFLLLGAAIFILHGLVAAPGGGTTGTIVVTAGRIENLATGFEKTWARRPTGEELKTLVDDWVREEIATREALALGLDTDDPVIRRRLRQKLEFVADDAAAHTEPTDAELADYLRTHSGLFAVEPRFTFSQIYLNPATHGDRLPRDTAQLLAQLSQPGNTDSSTLGDATLLAHAFTDVPASEVAKQFGDRFAASLVTLAPGRWQGPIDSGYGVHLVRVDRRSDGHAPELAEVHDAVRREWMNARLQDGTARFYQELLKRYTVRIESAGEHKSLAEAK